MDEARRQVRELRKSLTSLVTAVEQYVARLDVVMKEPSNVERGKKIAALTNELDLAKDLAKHFGLGLSLSKKMKEGKMSEKVSRIMSMIKRLKVSELTELTEKLKEMGLPPAMAGVAVKPKKGPPSLSAGAEQEVESEARRGVR